MNRISLILLSLVISSCSFHTAVTYQQEKKSEYIRQDGYILSCKKETINGKDFLIVGAYTPVTYRPYYTFLDGIKSDNAVAVQKVKIKFTDTGDTLELMKVSENYSYWFYSENLDDIIHRNKELKLSVQLEDLKTGRIERKEFLLTKKKRTYPTGTFPHA
ncbi:hypothetical protein [Rufibacter soli]